MEIVKNLQEKISKNEKKLENLTKKWWYSSEKYHSYITKIRKLRCEIEEIINNPEVIKKEAKEHFPQLFEKGPTEPKQRLRWLIDKLRNCDDICVAFCKMIIFGDDPFYKAGAKGVLVRLRKLREEKKNLLSSLCEKD